MDSQRTPTEGLRLQLWLARAGVASRRKAEEFILAGRVSVNGETVTELGRKALPTDEVRLDGKLLRLEERLVYLVLNKPAGYLSSMSDPEGRKLAVDLLPADLPERVYNVGRLDQWSKGLLLFTNDGELAKMLGHPSSGIEKEYEVQADDDLPPAFFFEFESGVRVEGVDYRARRVVRLGPRRARIILVEGKNREIRRVLEYYGRKALSLTRIRIGPIEAGDLAEGASRALSEAELEALRSAAGFPSPRNQSRREHP